MTADASRLAPSSAPAANLWTGLLLVAIAAIAFVTHNLLNKAVSTAGVSAPVLIFLRGIPVVLVLALWLRATRQQMTFPLGVVGILVALAMLNVINAFGIVWAIGFIPVSLAILLLFLFPVLTPLFSAALGDSSLSMAQMAAALLAFAGLAVALNVWNLQIDIIGILLGIAAAVSLALNIVFSARYMRRLPRLSVLLYLMAVVLAVATVYVIVDPGLGWPRGDTWTMVAGMMVAYAVAICAFYMAVDVMTPPRAGLPMNVEPIMTIFGAALFLNETLGLWQYVGAAIVIAAVFAVSLHNARRAAR